MVRRMQVICTVKFINEFVCEFKEPFNECQKTISQPSSVASSMTINMKVYFPHLQFSYNKGDSVVASCVASFFFTYNL